MRTAFFETGKSLDELSTAERKYFEDLTGLKGNDLYAAFDPANADMDFDAFMEGAEIAEEQMDPAEAMMKAADKMEKALDRMHKKSTGFFDSFTQGFMKGLTHVAMSSGVFKGLTDALDQVYKIGYDVAQVIFGEPDGFFVVDAKVVGRNSERGSKGFGASDAILRIEKHELTICNAAHGIQYVTLKLVSSRCL